LKSIESINISVARSLIRRVLDTPQINPVATIEPKNQKEDHEVYAITLN